MFLLVFICVFFRVSVSASIRVYVEVVVRPIGGYVDLHEFI